MKAYQNEQCVLGDLGSLLPPTSVRPTNYRKYAGCLGCRSVAVRAGLGVFVVRAVFNARKQGLDTAGDTNFYASCETHGTLCGFTRAREAKDAAFDPTAELDFCED